MEPEKQKNILAKLVKVLDELEIKYFVTGGFAVSIWGRPRATFDIDIVIKIAEHQAGKLAKAWKEISKFGYADEEAIKEAIRNNGEFNFIDPESGLKVDFWADEEDKNGPPEFENRKTEIINGQKVFFVSPEDLILSKLQWYKISPSYRHIDDIKSVIIISGKQLDKKYINSWIKKLDLTSIVEENKIDFK